MHAYTHTHTHTRKMAHAHAHKGQTMFTYIQSCVCIYLVWGCNTRWGTLKHPMKQTNVETWDVGRISKWQDFAWKPTWIVLTSWVAVSSSVFDFCLGEHVCLCWVCFFVCLSFKGMITFDRQQLWKELMSRKFAISMFSTLVVELFDYCKRWFLQQWVARTPGTCTYYRCPGASGGQRSLPHFVGTKRSPRTDGQAISVHNASCIFFRAIHVLIVLIEIQQAGKSRKDVVVDSRCLGLREAKGSEGLSVENQKKIPVHLSNVILMRTRRKHKCATLV